jgi:hypothetical protein
MVRDFSFRLGSWLGSWLGTSDSKVREVRDFFIKFSWKKNNKNNRALRGYMLYKREHFSKKSLTSLTLGSKLGNQVPNRDLTNSLTLGVQDA